MAVSAPKTSRKASSTPRRKAKRATGSPATRSTRRSASKPARRKSYSRRKKGFLAEMFTPASAMQAGTAMLMGGLGGVAANKAITDLFPDMKKGGRIALLSGLSFFMASVMKAPMVAAGIAAVAAIDLATPQGTAENSALAEKGYLQEQYLSQLPETLNEGYMNEGYMNEYNFESTDLTDFEEVM